MKEVRLEYVVALVVSLVCFLPIASGGRRERGTRGGKKLSPSEKAVRQMSADLQRMLHKSDNPQMYLNIKKKQKLMIEYYAAVECRRRKGSGEKVNKRIVTALMELHELLGYDHVLYWPNPARPGKRLDEGVALSMLRCFTCQFGASYEDIKVWWQKHKNEPRAQWAREGVKEVLSRERFGDIARADIVSITCNVRAFMWSKKKFMQWWDEFKGKTHDEWALDTLEWSIKHLGSDDKQKRQLARGGIYLVPPEARQINPRLLEGTASLRRKLKKWLEENRDDYRLSQFWPIGK